MPTPPWKQSSSPCRQMNSNVSVSSSAAVSQRRKSPRIDDLQVLLSAGIYSTSREQFGHDRYRDSRLCPGAPACFVRSSTPLRRKTQSAAAVGDPDGIASFERLPSPVRRRASGLFLALVGTSASLPHSHSPLSRIGGDRHLQREVSRRTPQSPRTIDSGSSGSVIGVISANSSSPNASPLVRQVGVGLICTSVPSGQTIGGSASARFARFSTVPLIACTSRLPAVVGPRCEILIDSILCLK